MPLPRFAGTTEPSSSDLRRIVAMVIGALVIMSLGWSGCAAIRSFNTADILRAEADQKRLGDAAEDSKRKMFENLVQQGIPPMAARCAIYGTNTTNERTMCEDVIKSGAAIVKVQPK